MAFDIASALGWLIPVIQVYGALSVFIAFMVEEVILPIPSPLVSMAAGFVMIPAGTSLESAVMTAFFVIALPGAVAIALSSLIIYAIGYYGGKPVISKFGRFFGTSVKKIEQTSEKMEKGKSIWISIIMLRMIFIVPTSIVSLAAGFLRINWKKFAISTFIGAVPRVFILSLIGWKLGSTYTSMANSFSFVGDVVFAIIIIALMGLAFYYLKFVRKGKHK